MRSLILTEYISLDGVIEDPTWTMPYWNDAIAQFKLQELLACDTLLLGRVTYQGFASAWPGRTDEQGFAERINSLPKLVATTTLRELDWNNSQPLGQNVVEEVRQRKAQPGQPILIYGSATLAETLLYHDLIDELRLLVFPLVLGRGKKLFRSGLLDAKGSLPLRLLEQRDFAPGVVLLRYARLEEGR